MTYLNPWAKDSEPKEYTRNIEPIQYLDCQIVKVHNFQYDIVKNGVCIGQRCGLEGAKRCADEVLDMLIPVDNMFEVVRERKLKRYGHY